MDKQRKTAVKVPKLKILWNKRKHKRRNELGLSFYCVSGDEDMEATYPDSGSVNDSNEGGLEELEEDREGAVEGGCVSFLGEIPSPNTWVMSQATFVVLHLNRDPLVNI